MTGNDQALGQDYPLIVKCDLSPEKIGEIKRLLAEAPPMPITIFREEELAMAQQNRISIKSDGTPGGTKITTADGHEIPGVRAFNLTGSWREGITAELRFCGPNEFEREAKCINIEEMAKALHESARESVVSGTTVAAEELGDQARTFQEWDQITETAREGKRSQAKYLLQNFYFAARPAHK